MNKRFIPGKLLPVWAAVSAVLLAAGIILCALFGYNYVAPETKSIEIGYDAVVQIELKDEALEKLCEDAISGGGLTYCEKTVSPELDMSYVSPTGNVVLTYTFGAETDSAALSSVADKILSGVKSSSDFANADIDVSVHTAAGEVFYEAVWRGAVAIAVAAIVALVYVGFRFGVGAAVAGLVACVNDSLLAAFLPALVRLPVYAYMPIMLAGIAAVFSLLLWLVQCMKMRGNFKDPAYTGLSAQEAVGQSVLSSVKFALCFIVPIAVVLVILGAIATSGLRLFMLSALIPLALSVYSSFLLAPAVLVPLKDKIDRYKVRHKRYVGKKKAAEAEE